MKLLKRQSAMFLIFFLAGCSDYQSANSNESISEINNHATNREGDFAVEIIQENEQFYGRLTYEGEESEVQISHGSTIFMFQLSSLENDLETGTVIDTLSQQRVMNAGETITEEVPFSEMEIEELPEGEYELTATANFTAGESKEIEAVKRVHKEETVLHDH
ncbi:hypothetical protein [Alkalicoccus luteus]|uniref:Uncharacterized protein n=1 Tax=Alkalicoccus luteus TaxID=1237094 RepID=A0A969PRF0_9BACI|nr:hypothetical protein [Alkalicoccus luteus]NJP39050.1 hypothetical protein [Alkalicoccus luteus]